MRALYVAVAISALVLAWCIWQYLSRDQWGLTPADYHAACAIERAAVERCGENSACRRDHAPHVEQMCERRSLDVSAEDEP